MKTQLTQREQKRLREVEREILNLDIAYYVRDYLKSTGGTREERALGEYALKMAEKEKRKNVKMSYLRDLLVKGKIPPGLVSALLNNVPFEMIQCDWQKKAIRKGYSALVDRLVGDAEDDEYFDGLGAVPERY